MTPEATRFSHHDLYVLPAAGFSGSPFIRLCVDPVYAVAHALTHEACSLT